MKISTINLGTLKVNAFEMIMGVPRSVILEKYNVDSEGVMRIGMNGLIVETGQRIIVFDPGCATFLSKSLAETYDLVMEKSLEESVGDAGYRVEEVTDVVFTHLHFDHGSGAFLRVIGGIVKAFPNARYVVSRKQLDHIGKLDAGQAGSFFHKLLRFAGELTYAEEWSAEGITFSLSDGHTTGMLVPVIDAGDHDVLYATDLVPTELQILEGAWSYYDEDRMLLEKERREVLASLRPGSEIIFYHEPVVSKK